MIDNVKLNLILASNSKTRKTLLSAAGIEFSSVSSGVDEDIIKMRNASLAIAPAQTAQDLADAKATAVAANLSLPNQSALILGVDQVCHMNGEIFNKPLSAVNLYKQIKKLSGKTHILSSAICLIMNGDIIYRYIDEAHLTMYDLSDAQITDYVERAAGDVLHTAAGYHLEQLGAQLFEKIDGDYFTILGLPMLPLIGFLKNHTNKWS